MFEFLYSTTLMSYRAPRAAMRRVLDRVDSFEGAALIYGIAFAANMLIVLLILELAAMGVLDGYGYDDLLLEFFMGAQAFLVSTVTIYLVGKLFRGRGRLREIAMAMAWFSFATVVLTPVWLLMTMPGIVGRIPASAAGIVALVVSIWLWTNFVAEAHGFASALRVAAVVVGIGLAFGVLMLLTVAAI